MQIKTYSKKELRVLYKVSADTFNNWLKDIEPLLPRYQRNAKILTPAQVRIVFEELGDPD